MKTIQLRDISTKSALMMHLHTELNLPDYFRYNWDSLEECLLDYTPTESVTIDATGFNLKLVADDVVVKDILRCVDASWRGRDNLCMVQGL